MSEIIYGIHAVKALLERDPQRFLEVFILKGREDRRLQPLIAELEATGIVIQVASRQWLDDKVEGAVHQDHRPGARRASVSGERSAGPVGAWKRHSCWCWTA